jgi:hypothetical protein
MGAKHHYVPQFLLKRFARPNTDAAISMFNVDNGHFVESTSISSQAQKRLLYGSQGMEERLARLEGEAASAIRRMIDRRRPPARDDPGHQILSLFLAAQLGRTIGAAEETTAFMTGMVRGTLTSGPKPIATKKQARNLKVSRPLPELSTAKDYIRMWAGFEDLASVLVINESEVEFVVSDIGVLRHNRWADEVDYTGVLAIASRGLQLLLPLSPRLMLVRFDGFAYKSMTRDRIQIKSAAQIEELNAFQMSEATSHVYLSGHTRTLEALRRSMPKTRTRPDERATLQKLRSDDGKKEIFLTFRPLGPFLPRLDWLPITFEAAGTPPKARGHLFRPDVLPTLEMLGSLPKDPGPPPPDIVGRSFEVVDD